MKRESSYGYKTYETMQDEFHDEEGYICNEIDIYPLTREEQNKLDALFELLEIPVSKKLFGHTKIFIATKELAIDDISELTKGKCTKVK